MPGATGEYEVTADHVPIVAEMKAGMLTINFEDGEEEKYFVAGGFSLTHEGSTTVSGILFMCVVETFYLILLYGLIHLFESLQYLSCFLSLDTDTTTITC